MFKTIAAGGQTWAHGVRMLRQVVRIAFFVSLFFSLVFFAWKMSKEPKHRFTAIYYYIKSGFAFDEVSVSSEFVEAVSGRAYHSQSVAVGKDQLAEISEAQMLLLWDTAKGNLKQTGGVGLLVFSLSSLFFFRRGKKGKRKKLISGRQVKIRRLKKLRSDGGLRVGKTTISKEAEPLHMLLTGGTGSGKTNALHHLIPQIRERGQKGIIIDTTSRFIESYYDPSKDFILNPFDARTQEWHPWADCKEIYDFEEIAHDFIPSSPNEHDPFWKNAARTVFESLLEKGKDNKSLPILCEKLMAATLTDLSDYLKGTPGGVEINPRGEKTAHSIRSQASNCLKSLKYFPKTDRPFSIQNWIRSDKKDSFLFLSCTKGQRSTLVPLMTVWFSIALRAAMTLEDDPERRVWFINDELPSMGKMASLKTCLAEGRSSGVCAVLAVQSPAQIDSIYGREDAKSIRGQLSTKLIFREKDPQVAEEVSRQAGRKEVMETQEGISYGANEIRDGVSQSMITRQKPVIPVSDIQSLKTGECFLIPHDGETIEKLKLKKASPKKIASLFEKKENIPNLSFHFIKENRSGEKEIEKEGTI